MKSWPSVAAAAARRRAKRAQAGKGTPRLNLDGSPVTAEQRFWRYAKTTESGCWQWSGPADTNGYGILRHGGRNHGAHRVSYEIHFGPIPEGLIICHRCDNPPCVNPAHLFLGTYVDNALDCLAKGRHAQTKKTHCPNGHAYSGDNLSIHTSGGRRCRACDRERHAAKTKETA